MDTTTIVRSASSRPAPSRKRDAILHSACEKAHRLAAQHRAGDHVHHDSDLTSTAQGDLQAAAGGWVGVSADLAKKCSAALKDWETAVRQRGERERHA
jgi:hypothetical protein